MTLRRKSGLVVALGVALTSLLICLHRSPVGERAASAAPPVETTGSDWTVRIKERGIIEICYKGVVIIRSQWVYWGKNWAWVGQDTKSTPGEGGEVKVVSNVPDLKMILTGDMRSPAPNVVQMDLTLQAQQAAPQVIGGGLAWMFKLDSPALRGNLPKPELLSNDQGWTWRVGNGQAITLRLDGSFAKAYFDSAQKNQVRTFFVSDRIEPGTRRLRMTLELPEGARRTPSAVERYETPNPSKWFPGALAPDAAPVDLSFLNRDDRPAGRRGFVRADGDRLIFGDGTPARFWGGNLVAYALFKTPREEVARQARRMASLGYNLMRIHHHDSSWVEPNIFGPTKANTSRRLDPRSLDSLDWWIKCLKDEGIYVWLDMHVARVLKPGDGRITGAEEIARQSNSIKTFCYYNSQLQDLMKEFQQAYLNHQNRYTSLRYKDDPAVMTVLITNENDMTGHGCFAVLPDKNNPVLNAVWTKGYKAFAQNYGLPPDRVFQTWVAGPSKIYLAQVEHEFNEKMIADLRQLGVKSPIVTTNFWGDEGLFALPPLTDSDLIDVHSYGFAEAIGANAHYDSNYLGWIAMAQVYGKPLTITEWNVQYPVPDRFTAPLYMASIASLQGWDAPMIYAYSQMPFLPNPGPEQWSTFHDPSLTAVMPAAALLFRRGHVSPARKTYYFAPSPSVLFDRGLVPNTSATIRTLTEQSKLTIGMPEVRELPWLKPSQPSGDAIVITDPDHDFIPEDQSFVRSDTGELTREWERGIQTIDTPRTQAVNGWIGGESLKTRDATFEARTKKAVVALSSVDDRPLSESGFVLVTAVARTIPSPGNRPPFLSEPVHCRITLRTKTPDLELLALGRDGRVVGRRPLNQQDGVLTFEVPTSGGTHWYALKTRNRPAQGNPPGGESDRSLPKGS
jgi:hypothetical protein